MARKALVRKIFVRLYFSEMLEIHWKQASGPPEARVLLDVVLVLLDVVAWRDALGSPRGPCETLGSPSRAPGSAWGRSWPEKRMSVR